MAATSSPSDYANRPMGSRTAASNSAAYLPAGKDRTLLRGARTASKQNIDLGHVRQCGVIWVCSTGLHDQAAFGVICSGGISSIWGVTRAAMPSICM
jgi:hypothetical protein